MHNCARFITRTEGIYLIGFFRETLTFFTETKSLNLAFLNSKYNRDVCDSQKVSLFPVDHSIYSTKTILGSIESNVMFYM